MEKTIVAVCNDEKCSQSLKQSGQKLGYKVKTEIQQNETIINEIKKYDIENAAIILFDTGTDVEAIDHIERFIDREYYEVDPLYVIENAEAVINEIIMDLN